MKTNYKLLSGLTAGIWVAGLLCWPPVSSYGQILLGSTSATGFSGQAAAVAGAAAGSSLSLASCGPLAVTGGAFEAAALETTVASGVAVGSCHTAVLGAGNASAAEAAVANVNLAASAGFFGLTTITAEFASARIVAVCGTLGASATAVVEVTGLVIDGAAVAVTGAANQFVFLADGGYVIINEQAFGMAGTTVNAIHVVDAIAGVNVVFATASAGITCGVVTSPSPPSNPPPTNSAPCDFVTGGGWITGTPSGAKANLGVAGGIKNGAFWGHLNYIDHGNGMHVKQTAVTGYAVDPTDSTCRIIDYNVTIDGMAGTARVRVCDKGEPGRNDIFQIQLSNGYFAGGDLGGSHPGGGNIQLHRCNN